MKGRLYVSTDGICILFYICWNLQVKYVKAESTAILLVSEYLIQFAKIFIKMKNTQKTELVEYYE